MKMLLVDGFIHDKNLQALLCYGFEVKRINIQQLNVQQNEYDLNEWIVYSPSTVFHVAPLIQRYPKAKFIFGPHVSVLPDRRILAIKSPNTVYIQPSEWVVNLWRVSGLDLKVIPFAVDTDKFTPLPRRNSELPVKPKVFIYYKQRDPSDLKYLETFLTERGVSYQIFSYNARYDENVYLSYLQESRYGIWLDAHESQGFALEEALSCNIPLLVWNVNRLNQEYGSKYLPLPATTIPYWDDRCGEYFYDKTELVASYDKFIARLGTYQPREYILENLSVDVCRKKFKDILNP